MNPVLEKMLQMFREMSTVRKVILGAVALMVVAGFTTLFVWNNKVQFKAAYTGLTKEDAALVVESLKESNTPYRPFRGRHHHFGT